MLIVRMHINQAGGCGQANSRARFMATQVAAYPKCLSFCRKMGQGWYSLMSLFEHDPHGSGVFKNQHSLV